MCFSAEASFGTGVVLSIVGIATIHQSRSKNQLLFAGIPLILAFQQMIEGYLWIALLNPAYSAWQQAATYIFLILAQVVWPTWIPLAIMLIKNEPRCKQLLKGVLVMGIIISSYLAYRLLTQSVWAQISGNHIDYHIGEINKMLHLSAMVYFLVTTIPAFLSSVKKMWLFGLSVGVSYLITNFFYERYVLSVWCFFAAVVSIVVFTIIFRLKDRQMRFVPYRNILWDNMLFKTSSNTGLTSIIMNTNISMSRVSVPRR